MPMAFAISMLGMIRASRHWHVGQRHQPRRDVLHCRSLLSPLLQRTTAVAVSNFGGQGSAKKKGNVRRFGRWMTSWPAPKTPQIRPRDGSQRASLGQNRWKIREVSFPSDFGKRQADLQSRTDTTLADGSWAKAVRDKSSTPVRDLPHLCHLASAAGQDRGAQFAHRSRSRPRRRKEMRTVSGIEQQAPRTSDRSRCSVNKKKNKRCHTAY
jgi:hypothetical protein